MCHPMPNIKVSITTAVLEKLYFLSSVMDGKQEICEEN